MKSQNKEFGKNLFACLTKTCLFELYLKSDLPNENFNGRSILTVQR